jgi:hypothetical protein
MPDKIESASPHPLADGPGAELQFGERGTVDAKDESPRGEASIEAYGRADELLRQDRQKEPESAINMYIGAEIGRGSLPERRSRAGEQLREYREGKQPFSAAALDYIELYRRDGSDVSADHRLSCATVARACTTKSLFLCGARRFSCHLRNLIELMDTGSS